MAPLPINDHTQALFRFLGGNDEARNTAIKAWLASGNDLVSVLEELASASELPAFVASAVDEAIEALKGDAPELLDTLEELAAALGNDENFATTVLAQIANKTPIGHTHELEDVGIFEPLPDTITVSVTGTAGTSVFGFPQTRSLTRTFTLVATGPDAFEYSESGINVVVSGAAVSVTFDGYAASSQVTWNGTLTAEIDNSVLVPLTNDITVNGDAWTFTGSNFGSVSISESELVDLSDLLDAKADVNHNHDGVYSPVGHTHAFEDVGVFELPPSTIELSSTGTIPGNIFGPTQRPLSLTRELVAGSSPGSFEYSEPGLTIDIPDFTQGNLVTVVFDNYAIGSRVWHGTITAQLTSATSTPVSYGVSQSVLVLAPVSHTLTVDGTSWTQTGANFGSATFTVGETYDLGDALDLKADVGSVAPAVHTHSFNDIQQLQQTGADATLVLSLVFTGGFLPEFEKTFLLQDDGSGGFFADDEQPEVVASVSAGGAVEIVFDNYQGFISGVVNGTLSGGDDWTVDSQTLTIVGTPLILDSAVPQGGTFSLGGEIVVTLGDTIAGLNNALTSTISTIPLGLLDIQDVDASQFPNDGDVLVWNESANLWVAGAPSVPSPQAETVNEGADTAATLANLISALESAGIIDFVEL